MREDAIDKRPAHLAELFFALRVPEQILPALADGNIGVHAAAVHAHHRLRQKRRVNPMLVATWRQISL